MVAEAVLVALAALVVVVVVVVVPLLPFGRYFSSCCSKTATRCLALFRRLFLRRKWFLFHRDCKQNPPGILLWEGNGAGVRRRGGSSHCHWQQ